MNLDNPLEIVILTFLVIFSIWMVERIIAGAFKTVIAGIFIVCLLLGYHYFFHVEKIKKHEKPLPKFTPRDFTDYYLFENKFDLYKDQAVKDIKFNYEEAKKQIEQNRK